MSGIPGKVIEGFPGTFTRAFKPTKIVEQPWLRSEMAQVQALGMENFKRFSMGAANILLSHEQAGKNGALLWHLSISLPHRHPTWDEIKFARYALIPDHVQCGIMMPPREEYVNHADQDHVFHVWEIE